VSGTTPNSADAVIEKVEFLGAYSRVAFRPERHRPGAQRRPLGERHELVPGEARRHDARGDPAGSRAGVRGSLSAVPHGNEAEGPLDRSHRQRAAGGRAGVLLAIFLLAPMVAILAKSIEDKGGVFVGFANFTEYFRTPALAKSIWNSIWVSTLVTAITIPLAFTFAYALTRSRMRFKALLRNVALVPILAPSLLAAISFIFWFGNQGLAKSWLFGGQIYGAPGIVISMVFATFPHALMILVTALSLTDARLYEAADALGTSAARKFWTITLPGAKYGIISAWMVVFTYALSDFGIPKVIGGNFNMLATDIFKLVIGQQDFPRARWWRSSCWCRSR
jgi:ABC-type Fe3+ transport system permease subunit